MDEGLGALPGRVDTIERKLDTLSSSVDRRFDQVDARFNEVDKRFHEVDKRFDEVDKRFDDVSQQFVEQRQYTEFAYDRLMETMVSGFERIERKLDQFIDRSRSTYRRRRAPRPKKS